MGFGVVLWYATRIIISVSIALAINATCQSPADASDDIAIVSRGDWGAKPPTKSMANNNPIRITIHHTGSQARSSLDIKSKLVALQRFSQSNASLSDGRVKPAWADVPYHYYIADDGVIAEGRSAKFVGDSNTSYNLQGHLSIVLEGNFDISPPTEAQITSLEKLLLHLSKRFSIDSNHLGAHMHYAKTACPGKKLLEILPNLKKSLAERIAKSDP